MPNDEQTQSAIQNNGPVDPSQWTIIELLKWTTGYFERHDIESPRSDAEVLLAHCMGCERLDLYLRFDQPLNKDELTFFKRLIKRRVEHEPVAYILGTKEFWSLSFSVSADVLIPRPDTECLVETALHFLPDESTGRVATVLELGVGSGAVIVSLAHERPHCTFWGSDRSPAATRIAQSNARENGVGERVHFFVANWFDSYRPCAQLFDMIISNPPYIPTADIPNLSPDIRRFEPITALDGGTDGLDDIRDIIHNAHRYLRPDGCLLLEIGFDQRASVESIVSNYGEYHKVAFHKDYGGHDRVAEIRLAD